VVDVGDVAAGKEIRAILIAVHDPEVGQGSMSHPRRQIRGVPPNGWTSVAAPTRARPSPEGTASRLSPFPMVRTSGSRSRTPDHHGGPTTSSSRTMPMADPVSKRLHSVTSPTPGVPIATRSR
jgi:hypothetical protein